jgi:hypothetical protein
MRLQDLNPIIIPRKSENEKLTDQFRFHDEHNNVEFTKEPLKNIFQYSACRREVLNRRKLRNSRK